MNADYVQLANALKQQRAAEEQRRLQAATQGGAATGTSQGVATMSGQPSSAFNSLYQQNQQPQQEQPNALQTAADGYKAYNNVQKARGLFGGAGSSLGATGTAYAGSGLGGTGFGLGGSLVSGGASGAGAGGGLGAMLGSYGGGAASSGGFGALGSTTAGGLGGLLGGGSAAAGSTLGGSAAAGGAAAGGTAAGAGGAAAGGGLAALGPFAALAAAIMWNEGDSRKRGLRSEDPNKYAQDLATGKVVEQDIEGKWAPKTDKMFGGLGGKLGLGNDQRFFGNVTTGDFGNAFKNLKDSSIGKIFKIF